MTSLIQREDGQGLVEYALVLVMVAIALILIITLLSSQIILAYASVISGLNGDSIDDNAVMLSSDSNTTGTAVCTVTMTDIRFIKTNADGRLITNETIAATVRANDVAGPTISGDAGSSGIATVAGPVSVTGSCPLTITLSD